MKIKENIHWVGALDPDTKQFDIIVKADNGTTYNSYLILDEKVVLIDTVKKRFTAEFIQKLKDILGDLKKIDYIILNHLEPDHSGALEELLPLTDAKVVVSENARLILKGLLKKDIEPILAGDGDELDIGKGTLKFIKAPFLHWPDTMFTYYEQQNIIFTCDFLGAHFCDERIVNSDTADYFHDFKYYFQAIMGPFKKYVLDALAKIRDLRFDTIATSHGPVIVKDAAKYIRAYKKWATLPTYDKPKIVIAYVSSYGNTAYIAQRLKDIFLDKKYIVDIFDLAATDIQIAINEIETADVLAVGSPTINGDAVKPVWDLISAFPLISVRGKIAAAFGSYGWSGEAPKLILERLKGLRFKTIDTPLRFQLIVDERNDEEIKGFAKQIEEAVK